MSDKWRWGLLIWHDWRRAVWWAEMKLYPRQFCGGGVERIPHRWEHAKAMHDYHFERSSAIHFQLFGYQLDSKD